MNMRLPPLDPSSNVPLQDQLCERISLAIAAGRIGTGTRLPSCRALAAQMGVARNTAIAAYQRLISDGLVVATPRSGYFVDPSADPSAWQERGGAQGASGVPGILRRHPPRFHPASHRVISRPWDWSSSPYPFVCNQLDPGEFPMSDWRRCSAWALSRMLAATTTSDHLYADCSELVEQLVTRLLPRRGIFANPDEVLIVAGAQQAIYLIAELLGGPDRRVAVEEPGYPDGRNILQLHFGDVVPVGTDAQGLRVADLPEDATAVMVTPNQQFPLGVVLSPERRQALLDWSDRTGGVIIEDDYGAEIEPAGTESTALYSQNKRAFMLYVGSLSKSISPGLRLGYLVGAEDFIREARALRGMMIRHCPPVLQMTAAQFIRLGHYDARLTRLKSLYRRRLEILDAAIARHMPYARIQPDTVGSMRLVSLPVASAAEVETRAAREGVLLDSTGPCYGQRGARPALIRIGITAIGEARIEPGIKALAAVVDRYRCEPARPVPPVLSQPVLCPNALCPNPLCQRV